MRTVPEWIGKTDDAKIPKLVKLRIFERCGGRCHITGRKIMTGDAYDFDHIKELWEGGEHRESNLAPAMRDKHREKSSAAQSRKAKADRTRAKHLGLWPKGQKIASRGFGKTRARPPVGGGSSPPNPSLPSIKRNTL